MTVTTFPCNLSVFVKNDLLLVRKVKHHEISNVSCKYSQSQINQYGLRMSGHGGHHNRTNMVIS